MNTCPEIQNFCLDFVRVTLTCCGSSLQSIKDGAIKAISEHCKELNFLCVSGCTQLTDAALQYLGAGCHELRYLTMRQCSLFEKQNLERV